MHKSHFKSIFFILLFTFLSIISGCNSVDKPAIPTVYLYPADGGLVKTDLHGSFKNKIISQIPVDVSIINGWIYYTIEDVNHNIILYKIKSDGTQNKMLSNISVAGFEVQKDWIYFTGTKDSGLYRMKTDGSEINCICNKRVTRFALCNNKIVLCTQDNINYILTKLYSMNTDGTDLIYLNISKNIMEIKASNNLILFIADESKSISTVSPSLYSMNLNQKSVKLITSSVGEFDIDNSHYIYTQVDDNYLYISKLNGTEVKKLNIISSQYGIGRIKIRGNEIFYVKDDNPYQETGPLYAVDINGKNNIKLPDYNLNNSNPMNSVEIDTNN